MDQQKKLLWALLGCGVGGALMVVCAAAAAGAYLLWLRPATTTRGPTAQPAATTRGPTALPPSGAYPRVERITAETAFEAYEAGTAVFVDSRPVDWYEEGHIPGALSIPVDEVGRRQGELDPQAWIITYCT